MVDDIDIISNLEITDRLGCIDHLSIDLVLDDDIDHNIPPNRVKRNYYRGKYDKAKELLHSVKWKSVYNMSLNDRCEFFYNNINTIIEQTVPEAQRVKKRQKSLCTDYFCEHLVEQNIEYGRNIAILGKGTIT